MIQKQKIIATFAILILCIEIVFADSGAVVETETKTADKASFLGIAKSRTARILDTFNERQKVLLFENVPVSSEDEAMIFDSDNQLKELEDQLKRVEDRKNLLKSRKRNVTKQKFDLKHALIDLDDSITQTEQDIKDKEQEITYKNGEISELTAKINEANDKIIANKKTILNYLSYIYSKGEGMYGDDNNVDVVRSMVLNDGDVGEMLSDMHYKTLLELSGQNLVEQRRDLVKEYYFNKEALKKSKLDSIRLKSELNLRKTELEEQKAYKEDLLEQTRGQEALYNKFILQKQQREEDIKLKMDNLENSYSDIFNNLGNKYDCDIKFSTGGVVLDNTLTGSEITQEKCLQVKKYFALEKKIREDDSIDMNGTNPLSWPAEPLRGISTYFHDEGYYASLGSEHEAIDIRYSQGTDLVAPAPGYVYFVSPPARGNYAYIALKHANGFVTVYGHISKTYVNQFDYVSAGQIFAKSGGAPGTPGAGPMTSGAHLHFEVFKDRNNVDPLRYMDVTHLDFDNLSLKYRYKYIEDLKLKYGDKRVNMDKFQKFYIAGESEIERQKYMLNKYASVEFNNWNIWVEEAMNGQVDPSFLICVGLAETGLGKHLKTGYNVGNIGNTDSGGTYSFDDPRDGISWMVRTLNNKYLRKYRSIDMLSRWGNKTGSIYASSSQNWHNNVVKCLSALKGRFIEDDYKFRLYESD